MNCREIEPLIYLVRDGELTEEEKAAVSEHIRNCPRCKELYGSVKVMTSAVLGADYNEGMPPAGELSPRRMMENLSRPALSYRFILLKAAAACLLLVLGFTFVMQERSFNHNRTELEARLQQEETGLPDCIKELRRRIHYHSLAAFARTDTAPVNLISEEALTSYVRENCGYNSNDIRAIKKLLIQAGLSD
jgi:hypothetical protein